MEPTDKTLAEVMSMLAGAFRFELDEMQLEAYRIGLAGMTSEQIRLAAAKVLQGDYEFMPPPGKLRQLGVTGGVTFEARADIAWNEFDRAVVSHGADHSVSFEDGLINATVTLCGGWIHCCEKIGDDYHVWLQKQFKGVYVRLCNSPSVSDDLLRPLVGHYEMQNAAFPNQVLGKLRAYTGKPLAIGTRQQVMFPPSTPAKRIERVATATPLRVGEVLALIKERT